MCGAKYSSFFLCMGLLNFSGTFVEEAFSSPLYVFGLFVNNHLPIYMWVYFWALNSLFYFIFIDLIKKYIL